MRIRRTVVVASIALAAFASATLAARVGSAAASPRDSSAVSRGAGRDYVAEVRAEFTPENRAYYSVRVKLAMIAPFYGLACLLVLLATGLSARLRDAAHARARGLYLRTLIYLSLAALVLTLFDLPRAWYSGYFLEHRFHLSNQGLLAWFGEQGKDLLVNIAVFGATGLAALGMRALEKRPRTWWLWLALGSVPLVVAGTLLQPLVIDPLYNRFTPLRDQELRAKIVALAEEAGIPGRRVYEVDKSQQTKKYNAYVTGFGVSQRIVLWDTTLEGMKEDEILFVMAHEMGHYRLAHIWKGIGFYAAMSLALCSLFGWLTGAIFARFGARWRLTALHDLAALPLILAALSVVWSVSDPISNAFSRHVEHQADGFALEITHDNDAGARAFMKLGSQNKSNPEPSALIKLLFATHPPVMERVRFALEYRPWERGEPNRYWRTAKRRVTVGPAPAPESLAR